MWSLKGLNEERRKIRWSNSSKTTKVFIATIITILIFILIISLFSWGVAAIIELSAN